jgi:hypothetical protein
LKDWEGKPIQVQRGRFSRVVSHARTGEFTPLGMYFNASVNSASDLDREITDTK